MNDVAERAAGEVAAIIGASPRHPTEGSADLIEPKIDELLSQVDSKYTLVTLAAKRARRSTPTTTSSARGRAEFVPPLVESGLRNKPLSIALEEISEGKINAERPEGVGIK